MRRFTDFFVFAAMLIIDFVMVYLLYSPELSTMNPNSFNMSFALLNLGFIALPALVLAMFVALVRGIWNIAPRLFYLVLLIASAASATLIWAISLAFGQQATPAQLSLPVFQFGAVAVAMFIALILGLTGAVPTAAKKVTQVQKQQETQSRPQEPATASPELKTSSATQSQARSVDSDSAIQSRAVSNSETDDERGTLAVTHSSRENTVRSAEDMKATGKETPYIGHEKARDDKETPYVGEEHHHSPDEEPMLGGSGDIKAAPRRVKGESDTDE
ncbi:MAG: hypothetical protein Q4P05_00305 [Actinomycetaceae bacterium]|nr:hypothetical protein [Actinomycetaceae bacterium]